MFPLEVHLNRVDLKVQSELKAFWYDETTRGASTFHLHVKSGDWKKWDEIIIGGESQNARLRWGAVQGRSVRWASWKEVLLYPVRFRYRYNVVEVWIDGVDGGYRLNERAHSLAFVDKLISQMVAELASKNKFSARVTPTQGKFTRYQGNLTDAEFIQKVLLKSAVSASGRPDYDFYIEDGTTVVFAPVDLSKVNAVYKVRQRPDVAHPNDIVVLDVDCRSLFRASEGSYSTEVRGYDPLLKEPIHKVMQDSLPGFKYVARHRPEPPASPASVQLVTAETEDAVTQCGEGTWGCKARSLFQTSLSVDYDIDARPGQVVELTMRYPDEKLHWTSGRWLVWKVRQWARPRGVGTVLHLERRAYE